MTDIELKPCPFCGGEARIIVVEKGVHSIIECTTHYCGFMRHSFNNGDTDENAALRLATAWNERTPKECHCKSTNHETLEDIQARNEVFELCPITRL